MFTNFFYTLKERKVPGQSTKRISEAVIFTVAIILSLPVISTCSAPPSGQPLNMQYKITEPSDLLSDDGTLTQKGWATDLILRYDRSKIRAPRYRIKEWDYYCILTDKYGTAFTIADNGYLGFVSVTLFDFTIPTEITKSIITPFPLGSFRMPNTSKEGDIIFENEKVSLKFIREKAQRIISIDFPMFSEGKSLTGRIQLYQPNTLESMVIATPFPENKHAFYYNQKINCMTAEGEIRFGDKEFQYKPQNSFGVLDWGRGVWPYSNVWYWGSGSGVVGNDLFGFNIGYGFGDTSMATENMLFYNGRAHKIEHVEFHIPEDSYLKPWTFTSSDSRFEATFEPIIDRYSNTNLILLQSKTHQVFGYFTGTAVLDDGKEINFDRFLGFAEQVNNRW